MMTTESQITAAIREHGYKLTPQRRAVISSISKTHQHLTPGEIYERLKEEHPGIGLVTVYRTLDILNELGLICETHAGGACRSYLIRRPAEHHHHLICLDCGKVIDFTECMVGEMQRIIAEKTKFAITGHLLEFVGLCPDCQEKAGQQEET